MEDFTINNLSEYMVYFEHHSPIKKSLWCFRGQANKDWHLSSTLNRKGLIFNEADLMTNLLLKYPNEFNNTLSNFDIMAKAQHFGLPTRLIDFTANPLVALYFACQRHEEAGKETDGKVFIVIANFDERSIISAEELCSYWRIAKEIYGCSLENKSYFINNNRKLYSHISDVYNLHRDSVFCIPKYLTQREINQKSVFLVETNKMQINGRDLSNEDYHGFPENRSLDHRPELLSNYSFNSSCFKEIEEDSNHFSKNIIIPANEKSKILKQLELIGISEEFVFPDLEHQLHALSTNISNHKQ